MTTHSLLVCLIISQACTSQLSGGLRPVELKCEYATAPLGVDAAQPRFSWVLQSSQRGQMQSAYQIVVASTEGKLQGDTGDKWDSGKVDSDRSVNVPYQGTALASGEKCWWKIRAWDKDGKSGPYSKPATFEMGLLEQSDWRGKWIVAMGDAFPVDYVQGKLGQGVRLDGQSQTIKIAHNKDLKPDKQITISAWVKPTGFRDGLWSEVYRKDDGMFRHFLAIGKERGQVFSLWFGLGVNGKFVYRGAPLEPSRLTDAKWHLVAATYDGSAIKFYFDGKSIGSSELTGPLDTTGSSPAYIGSHNGRAEFFAGGIDDVRIYKRALSDEEVETLAKADPDQGTAGLVGWWKLDGKLADSAGEKSGFASLGPTELVPLLRKEFEIPRKIGSARAYFSGLGWGELYINGKKVSDDVLSPAFTDYSKEIKYRTYDVTGLLKFA
jgi:hypothetical protein